MKKLVLTAVIAAVFITACSKDDDKKCEPCTSELGTKFEICDNGNGTYDVSYNGIKATIKEGELEGFTPKQVVRSECDDDKQTPQF